MDCKKIQSDFNKVIAYSQPDCPVPHTDNLFKKWKAQKAAFLDAFGGEPIVTLAKDVTFELNDEEKSKRIDKFLEWVGENYSEEVLTLLTTNCDSLLDNKLSYKYKDYPIGMKLSKVLMKEFGADAESLRNHLSMLIQEKKVHGDICMSVHPLDFLSLSESAHNWRSCHSLDGEYRGGNLSYMCDDNSFIVYMRAAEDTVLPRFPEDVPWNSKKWRMLIFWDEPHGCFWASRQYPFSTPVGMEYARQGIFKYLLTTYGEYYKKYIKWWSDAYNGTMEINGRVRAFSRTMWLYNEINPVLAPLNNYITNDENAVNYNDLLNGSSFRTSILKYKGKSILELGDVGKRFVIGAPAICCSCGKNIVSHSESMVCDECLLKSDREDIDDIGYCWSCGKRIFLDDNYFNSGYGHFCAKCYSDYEFVQCEICGEDYSKEMDEIFTDEEGRTICRSCRKEYYSEYQYRP